MKNHAEHQVTTEKYQKRHERFAYNTPTTNEAYWFREIFDDAFGSIAEKTVRSWNPPHEWGCSQDPSGRAQEDHLDAYHIDASSG